MKAIPFTMLGLCCLTSTTFAWDGSGHRIVGEIAMETLVTMNSPAVARIQQILSAGNTEPQDLAVAATVPDQIKDARYNKTQFPTDTHHTYNHFHFVDQQIPANASAPASADGNALNFLRYVKDDLTTAQQPKQLVWDLCWVAHLVGDMHQPLHAATHYWPELKTPDHFDQGGNLYFLQAVSTGQDPWKTPGAHAPQYAEELHAFWDDQFTSAEQARGYKAIAASIIAARPISGFPQATLEAPDTAWVAESYQLAQSAVYTSDLTRYKRPAASSGYAKRAHEVALDRIALAGYRLATMLHKLLGSTPASGSNG